MRWQIASLALVAACTSSAAPPVEPSRLPLSPSRLPLSPSLSSRSPSSSPPPSSSSASSPSSAPADRRTDGTAASSPAPPRGVALPLHDRTFDARQVITVVAPNEQSTSATLQRWRAVRGGWQRVGTSVAAFLGSDGMSAAPSESRSATPEGSFTLTTAFGRDPDPGTALPYRRTTAADWWISEPGPLYNTFQHCEGGCAFAQGDPNEHLAAITPEYDYAVVLDYNRSPVRQGAGSAFFLHVSAGVPTAGCVSIPRDRLVQVLRWLQPSRRPRILVGVG